MADSASASDIRNREAALPALVAAQAANKVVVSNGAGGEATYPDPYTVPVSAAHPQSNITFTSTTATCPVENATVATVPSGNYQQLPIRCPKCRYERLVYS